MEELKNQLEQLFESASGALCIREYYMENGDERAPVKVAIYPPEIGDLGPTCRFTIEGAGLAVDSFISGFDRLDAIMNSFFAVRTTLEELPHNVAWIGYPKMLNLPKQLSNGFGSHFERHCEELIDAEHAWATENRDKMKTLWPIKQRYEDCEGYKESMRAGYKKSLRVS